jgi:hypothetical protein
VGGHDLKCACAARRGTARTHTRVMPRSSLCALQWRWARRPTSRRTPTPPP